MKISSKLKKIISFMLVAVLIMSAVVLPVSAEETTTEETEKYTPMYDLSNAYFTNPVDLEYTGVRSDNLTSKFNVRQEYDMSFTMQDYYFCKPFNLTTYDGRNPVTMFTGDKSSYGDMFSFSYLQTATASFFEKNNLSLTNYDVYYYACTGRKQSSGIFDMYYYLVPKGRRIAITNARGPIFNNGEGVWGIYSKSSSFACLNNNDASMSIVYVHRRIDAYYNEITDDVNFVKTCTPPNAYIKDEAYYYKFEDKSFITGLYQQEAVCSNIPVFRTVEDTGLYVNEIRDPIPDNKVPVKEPEPDANDGDKLSADSFAWDSFKCRLSQVNNAYKFIYDYSYSSQIMKNDPSSFYMDIEYSQVIRYRNKLNMGAYADKTASKKSNLLVTSSGTSTDSMAVMDTKGSFGQQFIYSVCLLVDEASSFFGSGTDLSNIEIYSSTIYVTVVLKHKRFGSSPSRNDSFSNALCDISSDVRTFKFNALDLSNLDNPDTIQSDVSVKDIVDSNGNTKKEVSQIITNDDSTHTTINNYYYNSDGKQSSSPDGSDTLSDILSTLIKFIKTLVTEGLPAALEILQTLIKSLSSMISSALDGLNVRAGTSNGIIAVLKCIPASCWSLVVIAVIILVVVGVLKHIF